MTKSIDAFKHAIREYFTLEPVEDDYHVVPNHVPDRPFALLRLRKEEIECSPFNIMKLLLANLIYVQKYCKKHGPLNDKEQIHHLVECPLNLQYLYYVAEEEYKSFLKDVESSQ